VLKHLPDPAAALAWQVHRKYTPGTRHVVKGRGCARKDQKNFSGEIYRVIRAARIFLRRAGEKKPRKPDLCSVSAQSGGTRDQPP
jgi:hypothetical protein